MFFDIQSSNLSSYQNYFYLVSAFALYTKILTSFLLLLISKESPVDAFKVALCSFELLCKSNLGHQDYKSISETFNLIFISDIPQLSDDKTDQCRRFISLIDMLYNQNCSVVLLAQNPISSLCKIKSLSKEFERTASRLYEMTIIKQTK